MKINKEIKERAEKLKITIDEYRYRYHVLDDPTVTDEIYDSLMSELRELEKQFPELQSSYSPTQRIGGKTLDRFEKVEHKHRQWSLNDAFSLEEIKEWEERVSKILKKEGSNESIEYVTEVKIDGLKIILDYKGGILVRGATRGDGLVGEDVTENVKTIQSVPLKLSREINITVVGECWLSESELKRINSQRRESGEAEFANSRNAAAGSIRQLNASIAAKRKLDSYIYDVNFVGDSELIENPLTQLEKLELLQELGFKVNPNYKFFKKIDDIKNEYEAWSKKRNNQEYGIDGLVLKVNQLNLQSILGYTGKSPRYAIAWKFPTEKVTTVIEDITIQVGRTGALTPVAILRPVKVAGSVVSRATLHNEDEIVKKNIKIGDTIVIHKAGDIIPEVVEVIKGMRNGKERSFHMPKECPICGGIVEREIILDKKKDNSAAHYCKNPNCFAIEKEKISHFVSRKGFNIDGLGQKIVEQLILEGLISDAADIFTLKKGDLEALERFAEKSAQNLLEAISNSREVALEKFLFALGIRHLGEEGAILVKNHLLQGHNPSCPSDLVVIFEQFELDFIKDVDGIGDKLAQSLRNWFGDEDNINYLARMSKAGVKFIVDEKQTVSESIIFKDKSIVLTGALEKLTRDRAKDLIRTLGGKISSSVSGKTDFLVVGKNPGSKLVKAKELGVEVLTEDDFLTQVNGE